MSAEAPKGNQGRLPGFLRRFIAGEFELQSIPKSKPSVIQPPLGLENFADQIQSVVDGRFAAQRQKEHDIEAAKAAQIAASIEADRKAAEALSKPYRDEEDRKYREKQEQAAKEIAAVLEKFRVVERLEYIRDTIWGGKGEIRPVGGAVSVAGKKATYTHQNYEYNWATDRGGLSLIYSYPTCKRLYGSDVVGYRHYVKEQYVPSTNSTRLSVSVLNIEQDSGEDKQELTISSVVDVVYPDDWDYDHATYQTFTPRVIPIKIFDVNIPRDTEESEVLLAAALQQEAVIRVDRHYLPVQLEEPEWRKLTEAKKRPSWQKWKRTGAYSDHYPPLELG